MSYYDAGPRPYPTLKKLLAGEIIELEGVSLKALDKKLEPGDLYVAERNRPPQLLQVNYINEKHGWVASRENAYPFDIEECVPVAMV